MCCCDVILKHLHPQSHTYQNTYIYAQTHLYIQSCSNKTKIGYISIGFFYRKDGGQCFIGWRSFIWEEQCALMFNLYFICHPFLLHLSLLSSRFYFRNIAVLNKPFNGFFLCLFEYGEKKGVLAHL